ncbi:MAG: helix-turn-helix domain-containing protein [Clostridia bacterium]|nr:helix-turn-helix domain-containing protein [Clostridia bacterium]
MKETMGQIIRRLRKERNLTQEELAELLGVSCQAVSKWENDAGMPDISQVVPLVTVFGVSADVLFGITGTTADEEAWKIVTDAESIQRYGEADTYLAAYDVLMDGLKRFPNNLILMNRCMNLGLSLSLPENGWIYAGDRARQIAFETVRQANYVAANSKNVSDVMRARQVLIFLFCAEGKFDLAIRQAQDFPTRTDFTLCSHMAMVEEHRGNYQREAAYLCTDIAYALQTLEDNAVRLGKAYYHSGRYYDAIEVYQTYFGIMKAIFKDDCPPPYHDFDSGDCYLLLAQAYLAIGENDKAMDEVENAVQYYLELWSANDEPYIGWQQMMKAPLVRETEGLACIRKEVIPMRLLNKLSDEAIAPLAGEGRFVALLDEVKRMSLG